MQPLAMELRRRMRSEDPWDLLGLLTSIVHVAQVDATPGDEIVPLGAFAESLIGVDLAETTAALSVLRVLVDDPGLRSEIARSWRTDHSRCPTGSRTSTTRG